MAGLIVMAAPIIVMAGPDRPSLPAGTLLLRSAGGNGAVPVAGRRNSSFYGPGLRPGP